jgi:hypothetical protein
MPARDEPRIVPMSDISGVDDAGPEFDDQSTEAGGIGPKVALRLLFAAIGASLVATGAIALTRPSPSPPARHALSSNVTSGVSIYGSSEVIVSLNGSSSSSFQAVCSPPRSACVKIGASIPGS